MKYFVEVIFIVLIAGIFAPEAFPQQGTYQTKDDKMEALCKKGNVPACYKVGERYRILDRDDEKALEYYDMACKQGYMTGCTNAGIILALKGEPYSADFNKARVMFTKACQTGHGQACFNLGTLNFKEGQQSKAIKYYKKACGMDFKAGCAKEKRLKR